MELPDLLPPRYAYCKEAGNDQELFSLLVKDPAALLQFLEAACEDETWASSHPQFLQMTITWLSNRFFEDKLDWGLAHHYLETIRPHYSSLESFFPLDLTLQLKDEAVSVSTFLYGASSRFWQALIRSECREKNHDTISFPELPYEIFYQADAFIKTGDCLDLWRQEEEIVLAAMNLAVAWGLEQMGPICEEILERYITRENVVDKLTMAHRHSWHLLRQKCMDFFNAQTQEIALVSQGSLLGVEFFTLTENAYELFEKLKKEITYLIFSKGLTQEERFGEILQEMPGLEVLDISRSAGYSEYFREIPVSLQELNLSQCLWVNNENLKKMLQICPNLRKLSLHSNSQINYSGWGELRKLSYLENLELARCYLLTDEELAIVLQSCPRLLALNLAECVKLTDKSFEKMARSLPRITTLNLSRCSITEIPLIAIASQCRNLMELDLTRCVNLSEKGILEAVKNGKALRKIILTQCSIGFKVVEQLRHSYPAISFQV